MGFAEVLTLIFIVLKLLGVIEWNWFFVLLPEIIAIVGYIFVGVITHNVDKKIEEEFEKSKKENE